MWDVQTSMKWNDFDKRLSRPAWRSWLFGLWMSWPLWCLLHCLQPSPLAPSTHRAGWRRKASSVSVRHASTSAASSLSSALTRCEGLFYSTACCVFAGQFLMWFNWEGNADISKFARWTFVLFSREESNNFFSSLLTEGPFLLPDRNSYRGGPGCVGGGRGGTCWFLWDGSRSQAPA